MKLGVAVVVLFVGFDGDTVGRDMIIDGLLGTERLSPGAEGKTTLSAGEKSKSSVGKDDIGEAARKRVSASSEGVSIACPSWAISACGIGILDKIGAGRTRLGATRCEASVQKCHD